MSEEWEIGDMGDRPPREPKPDTRSLEEICASERRFGQMIERERWLTGLYLIPQAIISIGAFYIIAHGNWVERHKNKQPPSKGKDHE